MRENTKAMSKRGDISDVTAPAHTHVWFAVYAGNESLAKKIPLMPVALLVVKSVKPFHVIYKVRRRRFLVFY